VGVKKELNFKYMNTNNGIGLGTLMFLIFLVLKLTNFIQWSWWWITAPLWIPIALVGILTIIGLGLIRYEEKQKNK
jgi:hypothetical protein